MTEAGALSPITLTDPADPRLLPYRDLKDTTSRSPSTFIAESELVVRKLLGSSLTVESVLVTAPRWNSLQDAFASRASVPPAYLVAQDVMDQVAGLHVHRGCLAIGIRPGAATVPGGARLIVALEDLVDVDNLGAIVRNSCAFGADALLLSPRCADPYYRKAIRTAAGNTFGLPIIRARHWPDDLRDLRARLSARIVGAVCDENATPLSHLAASPSSVGPLIVLFGSEGPGLTAETQRLCDERVTIPMSRADSLNVATACAVFLYQLTANR